MLSTSFKTVGNIKNEATNTRVVDVRMALENKIFQESNCKKLKFDTCNWTPTIKINNDKIFLMQ